MSTDLSEKQTSANNENNNKNNNVDDSVKITKEFEENVINYVKIDDIIRKKDKELKQLKLLKKNNEKFILKYLDTVGEKVIEITDGKLRKNKSETKKSLSIAAITNIIKEKIKDQKIIEEILNDVNNKREKVVHVNLKRTKKKTK